MPHKTKQTLSRAGPFNRCDQASINKHRIESFLPGFHQENRPINPPDGFDIKAEIKAIVIRYIG
ncbi:hypothetical protein WAE56_12680 [Iodobacter sp. LRB]|uniref:hypothetical protein n=1 Tax=unclassified Iodobacter TaxID=235634 RepID=UPI000C1014E0|nr:hypothetical protein [Iodobacter sp. BJB302]PHV00913.1 hypothetical protein CSQ88_14930 [Iodobacter sp. BJB302]